MSKRAKTKTKTWLDETHWDPERHERKYYYDKKTGQRAYLVRRDDETCIKLDRPQEDIVRKFKEGQWEEAEPEDHLNEAHIAMCCFAADREYCRLTGEHEQGRLEWNSLTQLHREAWMKTGPDPERYPKRAQLYAAVKEAVS